MRYYFDKIIDTITKYLLRSKFLYKIVGLLAIISLLSEFAAIHLPDTLIPNYEDVKANYGYLPALTLGLFIGKYAAEYDIFAIIIKLFVVLFCLYMEYKNQKIQGNRKTIWNFFFGIKQDINQHYE